MSRREPVNEHEANDLYLYTANTGELYPMRKNIEANLEKHSRAGRYERVRAIKAFRYLIDAAVPRYRREIERDEGEPAPRFSPATRDAAAAKFASLFEANTGAPRGGKRRGTKLRCARCKCEHPRGRCICNPAELALMARPQRPGHRYVASGAHGRQDMLLAPRGGKRRAASGAALIKAAKALKAAWR